MRHDVDYGILAERILAARAAFDNSRVSETLTPLPNS